VAKVILGVLLTLVIVGCTIDSDDPAPASVAEEMIGTWALTRIERGGVIGTREQIDQTDSMYVLCFDFTVVRMTLNSDGSGQVWVEEDGVVTGPCLCYWTEDLAIQWLCGGDPSTHSWYATRSIYSNQNEMLVYQSCPQGDPANRYYYWTYNRE
jgi:hypothetical protein